MNFNGKHLLEKHLPSVMKTDYPLFDIVVIDNDSTDDSVAFVKKTYPHIKVVKNKENVGFGRANNVIFEKYPNYDYFALLNNDMDIDPAWLRSLAETAESDDKIAAVGSKILYKNKRGNKYIVNSAGIRVDKHFFSFDKGDGEIDSVKFNKIKEVDALCGGALLLRSDAVKQIKGFDSRMFFYYEDVDLSLRLKDNGWKLVYNGNSVVYHDHMGTSASWGSARRTFVSNINRIRSIWRRVGAFEALKELIRTPLLWLWSKISGQSFKEILIKG
ncbi:glycosyltransferase family 2 protein [Candidatus Dojkabacteria bacterium]|nr:glycosyltransferase family 2 protein [Candidatus Dojkabacteria bacterium]